MSEAGQPERGRWVRGCLLRALIAIGVLVVVGLAIGLAFDNDDANVPTDDVNAGPAENYERGDVSYIASEHIYVTRLEDGTFIALYDKSPKQQELNSACRVFFDEFAQLGPLEQLAGIKGAFVEECEATRGVWRADGERAFGAGYGDLDRFNTRTNDEGELIVDTGTRTCTRSRGTGVPPFTETACRGNE
ncbi:MAG: hypothetical protein WEB52_03840 [Dehalococcoidia bacterium]